MTYNYSKKRNKNKNDADILGHTSFQTEDADTRYFKKPSFLLYNQHQTTNY